ncbi:MAG: hypothetical protein ACUVTX_05660, partial [Bacteroidales bacterium]
MYNTRLNYFCLIIIFLLFSNTLIAQTWAKIYGADADDFPRTIIAGYDDTYIMAGWTRSSIDYNGDFWIVNIDKFGNILWQKSYGGNDGDSAF